MGQNRPILAAARGGEPPRVVLGGMFLGRALRSRGLRRMAHAAQDRLTKVPGRALELVPAPKFILNEAGIRAACFLYF